MARMVDFGRASETDMNQISSIRSIIEDVKAAKDRERARMDLAMRLTGGDQDAADLLMSLGDLMRAADNLADNAHGWSFDRRTEAVADFLHAALCEIPANRFFAANADKLLPLFASAIAQWRVSNRFQISDDEEKAQAGYVLREANEALFMQISALCVGWHMAADAFEAVFDFTRDHRAPESPETWVAEAEDD
jgi:hypothetical protein